MAAVPGRLVSKPGPGGPKRVNPPASALTTAHASHLTVVVCAGQMGVSRGAAGAVPVSKQTRALGPWLAGNPQAPAHLLQQHHRNRHRLPPPAVTPAPGPTQRRRTSARVRL